MAKFAEVLSIINGRNQSKVENPNGIYPIYGSGGIMGYADSFLCKANTVVIGRKGNINKPIFVESPFWNVDTAFGLEANQNMLMPKYLYYFCEQYDFEKLNTTVTIPSLTKANLLQIDIPLPPLIKQQEIVEKIDKVVDLISLRKKQLQKLDDLIKSRFAEMFGYINEYCDVGYYIKALVAGKSLASEEECENKVLKTGAASFDFFDATQVKNLPLDYVPQQEHLVSVGDVIISRMNTTELTGAAAYVWDVPKNIYLPDRLWKAILYNNSNPIFVWQMLIQPSTKEQIMRECSGTSGSMKNISKAGLLAIKVKKVPITMQNQFADFVKQVYKSEIIIQQGLNKLEQMKQALMQKYFG